MKEIRTLPIGDRTRALLALSVFLNNLPSDRPWKLTIEPYREPRTNDQNEALWGLAYKLLRDATGNDIEDIHTYFCGEYFGWVEYKLFGQLRKRPRRTTTRDADGNKAVLSTLDFAAFFDFVQRRAAEVAGVYIPDPDPQWREAS